MSDVYADTNISPPHSHQRIESLYGRHLASSQARLATTMNLPVERVAEGAWIETTEGEKLLNCGGYGVFFLGAGHRHVVEAVGEQLERLALSTRVLLNEAAPQAAETLTSVAPKGLSKVYFSVSGSEAIEAAIKLARANGKRRLIATKGGYHGKTMGALSLTGRDVYRDAFTPLLPMVEHVEFGDIEAMETAVDSQSCVVVEPIQSEGGVIIPPDGYLRSIRQLCDDRGALLVLDEIMTGLGRVGSWWAADQEQITPDVLLSGKALSGGLVPVAATITTEELYSPLDDDFFLHTSTYSAAPICMAAVQATIETIKHHGLVDRSRELGARIIDGIRQIATEKIPHLVANVRGRGLLIGIEFIAPAHAGEFLLEAPHNGLLVNHSMNANSVVRLTPPAILTDNEVDELLARIEMICSELAKNQPLTVSAS